MKKIRNGVFETNSSSTHSLTFKSGHGLEPFGISVNEYGYIEPTFGEYGWGYEELHNQECKLSYLFTMIAMTELRKDIKHNRVSAKELFMRTDGFNKLNEWALQYCNGITLDHLEMELEREEWRSQPNYALDIDGYIDHQSCEDYNSLQDFLDDYNATINEIILNPTAYIIIDNDNRY